LPNHHKLREQIDSVLDMELIKQQMDKETFDYRQYGLFVIDTMSKLCAPARDSAIEQLRASSDPVTLFKYI
jgi:proline dehydrogenase